jgi:hypothetical protein
LESRLSLPLQRREGAKMANQKPTEAGKARAASIHAEIDKLTGASGTPLEAEEPGKTGAKAPLSPRDFINQYMAEHDKKPEDK